jgi:hypothetical protein
VWRYLKAAFLAAPDLPGLGRFPLNLVALAGCAVLGLANPGFWFIGLGLELAYLLWLTSNPRFRRWVDAAARPVPGIDPQAQRSQLIEHLPPTLRSAHADIEARAERALAAGADELRRDAVGRLVWTHLKLVVAQATLDGPDWNQGEAELRQRLAALEAELSGDLPTDVRASKDATAGILRRRLANRDERARQLAAIAADRARIAEQIELAREDAAIGARPAAGYDVELASSLLDFGADSAAVADLERHYATPARVTA